ncbi:putative heterokaryon incompatibility protein [Phaeoacremonium minimum UCRPA7]|uniref:Putative heterokaryon incompatibility protein n=1 Tax=Phaeoacremonium minimum (strain UCR-PA7) TaxID=1286976 RepID=R8BXS4_PHAM7|nr:putative heterokaryon incompatibility protein [Phaeoacremonium minimum UCRPA7]EOO04153.1 putative heterokaryon incompatibility protein [Phaeoacremonium minimum UCRPA7]
MARDTEILGLKPDYTKNYEEVLIETAWRLMDRGNPVLDVARGMRQTPLAPDLPSWVPDWSLRPVSTLNPTVIPNEDARFSAGGEAESAVKPILGPIIKTTDVTSRTCPHSGKIIAQVTRVGEIASFNAPRETPDNLHKAQRFLHSLRSFTNSPGNSSRQWATDDRYPGDAIWKVPIAHRRVSKSHDFRITQDLGEDVQLRDDFGILIGDTSPPQENMFESMDAWTLRSAKVYLDRVCRYADEKRPLLAYHDGMGYLGMGPSEMAVNDVVCIIQHARVPYVLRPTDGGAYLVVGEAYVHGLMYGEGLALGDFIKIILL